MKKSPMHPNYEMDHDHSNEFDPHTDFYQFLEEAKHYVVEGDFQASSEEGAERRLGQVKKKKSWKKFMFPWLKGEKLNKTTTRPATVSHISNAKRTNVSGPLYGTGKATDGKHRGPMSGPIANLPVSSIPQREKTMQCLICALTRMAALKLEKLLGQFIW